jgi:hypothetical protein
MDWARVQTDRRGERPGAGTNAAGALGSILESIAALAVDWLMEGRVLEWLKRRRPTADHLPEPDPASAASERPRPSSPFHKYLAERYADTVVLTFAEIEDLIGFALPARARLSADWWTAPEPSGVARSRYMDAWIQAHRTARPNLQARTVAFERQVA